MSQVTKLNERIVIDGVVGVGKSTLLKILVEERGYTPFMEDVENNPILEGFYMDRKKYSFPLQVFFLNKRFKYIKKSNKIPRVIMDRSIYGDGIFAKMHVDSGDMTKIEYKIYKELFENIINICSPPKLLIYMEINTGNVITRIKKRGRQPELIVENQYWERLNHYYRELFDNYNHSQILKINVDNLDFENNTNDRSYIVNLIDDKIKHINKNQG